LPAAEENLESYRPWAPQPGPQTEAITADWCPELLYGGAVGGGKSDFLLGDYLQDVPTYGMAWRGILLRRTYPELEELMFRSREMYPQTGAKWNEQKKQWVWPNGANLKLRYCESDKDVLRYQGHQYTWIGWDELTQWPTLFPYRYLRSRLRSAHQVPTKRIRAASNPGGPGHLEVKAYFVDPAPGGFVPVVDPHTSLERMFIPSRLDNNLILMQRDPTYLQRVKGLGSDTLVKALLDGDWSIIEGAFFDCWSSSRHVIRPFTIPGHWLRFRSMDWGFASPFSVGWWAVPSDDYQHPDGRIIPRGAMVRYREWYGVKHENGLAVPNVGLRLTADEVADGIRARETSENISYGVLDPSAFDQNGGPSIAERMMGRGVVFRRADNKRAGTKGALGGWDMMRHRMKGQQFEDGTDGDPMLYVFSTCSDFIRTVPVLQHDKDHPEDLDTDMEDHAGDETRYGCMSRPWIPSRPKPKTPVIDTRIPTIGEMVKDMERRRRGGSDKRI
jgi:hypothetical protein